MLMWMLWSNLLPALTFFNGVELSTYMVDVIDPETGQATKVERILSLWNVMQALVVAAVTIIAARNLPSFLEIFVLSIRRHRFRSSENYRELCVGSYYPV